MKCIRKTKEGRPCKEKGCRYWIDYEEDSNCSLITVDKHGRITLREVAERLGVSYVRIKQIEDKAILKLKKENFV